MHVEQVGLTYNLQDKLQDNLQTIMYLFYYV